MLRKTVSTMVLILLIGMLTLAFDIRTVGPAGSTNYGVVSASGYIDVDASEAKQMIESNPDLAILDVRTLEEYESGHIENAVLIPVTELEYRIDELDKQKDTLVYCKSGGRSATASQILVDNGFSSVYNMLGGITAWRNAGYWIEIIHRGDLIIDGTQTYMIEKCTYIQTGATLVTDYATLIITDAEFIVNQTHSWEYPIKIEKNANLTMHNANIRDLFNWCSQLECFESSSAQINNSEVQGLWIHDLSKVLVINSIAQYVKCWGGNAHITNSTVSEDVSCFGLSLVSVLNSTVLYYVECFHSSIISVKNSTIGILLSFTDISSASLSLHPGHTRYWNNHANETMHGIDYNITVMNSEIRGWYLECLDSCMVSVTNSTMERVRCRDNALVHLNNCALDASYEPYLSGLCQVYFNEVLLFNGFLNTDWITYYSEFFIYGNITVSEKAEVVWWNSNVTRNFNVIVINETSDPLAYAKLKLYDQNETVAWTGATDSLGKIDFNVTFTDNNYTDTLRLKAVKGKWSATTNITFVSETPVIMEINTTCQTSWETSFIGLGGYPLIGFAVYNGQLYAASDNTL